MDDENLNVEIDDSGIDTLTIKFWRDGGYNGKPCPADAPWACHIGINFVEGVGGFGPTPLAALQDLCKNIGRDEGHRTDHGKLLLR